MHIEQLDLFDDFYPVPSLHESDREKDTRRMKEEIKSLRESSEKVRKGIFAKHGALAKMYLEIHQRLEILERNICKGK